MKMQRKQSVIEIEEDDDEDFLSQVAAAEAHALASKRRRITPSPSANAVVSKQVVDNGLYMAALKGDQTIVRPSTASNPLRGRPPNARGLKVADSGNDDVVGAAAAADSCFKCGKSGHWARDCDAVGGGHYGNYGTDPSIPEKTCPCGLGICMVLTANTEKNRGRKFYKCPLRQENGGCGFFEWFDNVSGANSMVGGNYSSDSSYPGLQCPCGAGLCMILTAKTGNNIGQQFYRCPANQGSSCGFFKWCNEQTASVGRTVTASNTSYNVRTGSSSYNSSDINNISSNVRTGSSSYNLSDTNHTSFNVRTGSSSYNLSDTNHTSFNVRTGSSCFKCGKEGHWARDCSISSLNPQAELGGRSASVSSGTCYKCGKPGHWSRDCTFC